MYGLIDYRFAFFLDNESNDYVRYLADEIELLILENFNQNSGGR